MFTTYRGNFKEKFDFYSGTRSISDLENTIIKLGLPLSKCYFIRFLNQYYAVFYDTYEREVIIGKEKLFFANEGRLEKTTIEEAVIPYSIYSRDNKSIRETLARELNEIDPNLDVFYYPNSTSSIIKKAPEHIKISKYVVILGVTFSSKFFDLNNIYEMEPYFNLTTELQSFLYRTRGAEAIDPFKQLIRFQDGSLCKYRIYEYGDRYQAHRFSFALVGRNYYRSTGREWISLSRYQALYPGDFILYEKPDYRVDKKTCKWCGYKLEGRRRHYCSDNCRNEFYNATETEKGAALPYRILCRDNFTCQKCGEDMAFVNEYGMKIPVSRKAAIPDKDGVYRREAEVHHIVTVEDGGEDFQENLSTRCQECHKGEHKVRKKKKSNVIQFRPRR